MKKIVLSLLTGVMMVGCAKDIAPEDGSPVPVIFEPTADEIKLLTERTLPAKLASGEIDRIIADVVAMLETGPEPETATTTRSSDTRTVAAIRPLVHGNQAGWTTRTASFRDTLFHIVDFTDGRGYCVISADRRLPDEIICFVEHGSFPETLAPENPAANHGLALMMNAAHGWAHHALDRHKAWCDSVETALLTRTGATSLDRLTVPESVYTRTSAMPYEPSWHFHRRIGPLLPVEWSQRAPFNATVIENTPWSNTPVGCVALAAVQIMAYWKYPTKFHGLAGDSIDWNEIRRWSGPNWDRRDGYGQWDGPMSAAPEETRKLVADILWHVGDDIDMNYGSSNSTAYSSKATALLAMHGFSEAHITGYSTESVLKDIEARRPVMIDGASHWSDDGPYYANAHAWVIDGYLEQRWWNAFFIDNHMYETERFRGFFHNNFGWGGTDNGYYSVGVFDANNNPDLPSATQGDTRTDTKAIEWQGEDYNYQFMQTIYTNIYK